VKYLRSRKYLDALCVYFWATTPIIIAILTFATVRKRVNLESRAWNLRRLSSVKRNQYIQRLCADGVQLIFLNNSVLLFLRRFLFLPDILTPAPIASWFFLRYYCEVSLGQDKTCCLLGISISAHYPIANLDLQMNDWEWRRK